ncbi:MAG: ACP S-malonyltransferase [Opitutales bacterium]|nr:ACP S-malonyltransferase [Opitutales bacterium]
MSTAFLFPGQGSQSVGMGAELFSRFPDMVEQSDQILGYSIEELCLREDATDLNLTNFTQPALYTVSCLQAKALLEEGKSPSFAAGHSVGEFAALQCANAFSFADGLQMVAKRGEIMSKVSGGGMAAVIGMDTDKISSVLEEQGADQIDLANFNSPGQIVISGPASQITQVLSPLKDGGARMVVPLKVSGAFHSRMMKEPAVQFSQFLEDFLFRIPEFPVFSNVEAQPYSSAEAIPELLIRQIFSPVKWTEVIQGIRGNSVEEFIECGPGKVLTKLLRQIP